MPNRKKKRECNIKNNHYNCNDIFFIVDLAIIILLKQIRLCAAVSDVNIFSKTDVYVLSKHKFNTFRIPFQE